MVKEVVEEAVQGGGLGGGSGRQLSRVRCFVQ